MNWEAVSAIAELIGSLAVLATLIYLAVQVRHSRDLLEENRKLGLSQVYQARASSRLERFNLIADPKILLPLLARAKELNLDELSAEEKVVLGAFYTGEVLHLDNVLFQHELGLVEPKDFGADKNILENYSFWKQLGVRVTKRIADWYDENKPKDA